MLLQLQETGIMRTRLLSCRLARRTDSRTSRTMVGLTSRLAMSGKNPKLVTANGTNRSSLAKRVERTSLQSKRTTISLWVKVRSKEANMRRSVR